MRLLVIAVLLSCVCQVRCRVVVAVLLDVLVEGAAGVGHEHGLEGRLLAVVLGDESLEPLGRVLGDHATPVEDRDPAAEALRLGQVVRREDDRGVVRRR